MSDDGRRAAGGLRQVPLAWRVTLYALWLVLLTAAFILHVPALAVVAAIATAVQSAYIIFVAASGTKSASGSRPRLSPRQIKILFWWRIGLLLVWLAFLVVAFVVWEHESASWMTARRR
jgi:hypothetical protein